MSRFLCLSVKFLDPAFHGRGDGGIPEWPPSPLRAYQALVAAGRAKWRDEGFAGTVTSALQWLERNAPPLILAPKAHRGLPYRLSVPNNAMDVVARFWARGNETAKDAQPSTHRELKTVRPTHMIGGDTVSYLWDISGDPQTDALGYVEILSVTARHLVALGWGIDLVAGQGQVLSQEEADKRPGERWRPAGKSGGGTPLRVPIEGSLAALQARHASFLNRVAGDGFVPVPSLPASAFREVAYRREIDMPPRYHAAFRIVHPETGDYRPFPATQSVVVAAMLRHACREAAQAAGRDQAWIDEYVCGHRRATPQRRARRGSRTFRCPRSNPAATARSATLSARSAGSSSPSRSTGMGRRLTG
jgi:CRISPR-associated protein Csb2